MWWRNCYWNYLKIFNFIRYIGLAIGNLRGQGYGKAGNRVVHNLNLNDKALYFHCFNHWFILAFAKSCNIQKVRNLMGIIIWAWLYFFNLSPKREQLLKDVKIYLT